MICCIRQKVDKMISEDTELGTDDFGESEDRYPFYLFIMLWHISHPEHSELEYDIAYLMMLEAWSSFVGSDYDDDSIDLYTCISSYLAGETSETQQINQVEEQPSLSENEERINLMGAT